MGHSVVPSLDPHAYVQRPWNSWTFQRTEFTTADFETVDITVQDVVDQIRSRCNINATGASGEANQIQVRIQAGYFWVTAASLIQPDLEAQFYELSPVVPISQNVRSTQRDVGTLNMPAKVGYSFPSTDSKEVLGTNDGNSKIMSCTAAANGSRVTSRIILLWKSSS